MRQEFVEAKNRKEATRKAPWAVAIIKVAGGYMAFASVREYETWKRQK
jgi:hypothetical protein